MSDALKDLFGDPGNPDSILQNLTTICRVREKDEEEMWRLGVFLVALRSFTLIGQRPGIPCWLRHLKQLSGQRVCYERLL